MFVTIKSLIYTALQNAQYDDSVISPQFERFIRMLWTASRLGAIELSEINLGLDRSAQISIFMDRHTLSTPLNSRLPADVLHLIFTEYVKEETPEYPLESLLLVCRFWTASALECRSIWARFNIVIEIISTVQNWLRIIPRRLARSGSSSPITLMVYSAIHVKCHCMF
jgi:hypothetical protein